jgi:hypothetical protein
MAIRAERRDPARVIWSRIGQPPQVMRFEIGRPIWALERSWLSTSFADAFRPAEDIDPHGLASQIGALLALLGADALLRALESSLPECFEWLLPETLEPGVTSCWSRLDKPAGDACR